MTEPDIKDFFIRKPLLSVLNPKYSPHIPKVVSLPRFTKL